MFYNDSVVKVVLLLTIFGFGRNGGTRQTTEKETRPEYIHPDGLLNFDPYLSDFKTHEEDEDYIPLPENDETIDGLPIFLLEPKNTYVTRNKPSTLICKAANALQVYYKCNDIRKEAEKFEHVDPQNGVRVVEAELNVTKEEIDRHFDGSQGVYSCECFAWNSKGQIRSQGVFLEYAFIKKQFGQHPQSMTVEAGHGVTLRCVPPPAAPPATIKWMRNGQALEANNEVLVLPRISLQDMANYTCVAENIAGRRESDTAVVSVYVNGGWSDWSPWIPCTCGHQVRGRRKTRTCTEPAPANGGSPCRGVSSQNDKNCLSCPHGGGIWSAWSSWSSCNADCVRIRRRECTGTCSGSDMEHAACVDGLCTMGIGMYKNNTTIYVGVGVAIAMLVAGCVLLFVWCKNRKITPVYMAATCRSGMSKKSNAAPDLTRTYNEYLMPGPDTSYDLPQIRDSYSSPFGHISAHRSVEGSNHYEMKPYSPSGDSASSCYTNTRTMTSHSSEYSTSQLAELVTSTPSTMSKVDVAVTMPNAPSTASYRDKICLTIVK